MSSKNPNPLKGTLNVPGDKSISHRAILFAAMAEGKTELRGLLDSQDVRSTIGAVKALGATVELTAVNNALNGYVHGWGAKGPTQPSAPIDCGNSGTTTRLLMGVLAGWSISAQLKGDASLSTRPMARVLDPLVKMGASYQSLGARGKLPLVITGCANSQPLIYNSPVASAQVKSALILAGLQASGTTTVCEPALSRNHTELMLKAFGVCVEVSDLAVSVSGPQILQSARQIVVPGDPSSAAFLLVAAALTPGSDITVKNISLNPTRSAFLQVMRAMGASVEILPAQTALLGGEPVGDARVVHSPNLRGTVVEPQAIPALIDEVPILALLATAANTPVIFRQVGELRVKESDRLAAIIKGLTIMGSKARTVNDDLIVEPGIPLRAGVELQTHGDHRFAMTWAVASSAFGLELQINDLESMAVSYPGFLDDLRRLQ